MSGTGPRRAALRGPVFLLVSVLLLLHAPSANSKDSAYMAQAKAVVGFRFQGQLANNEVVLLPESKLPKSLHHVVLGLDGLLYASSFISSEVYSASLDERGVWRWWRVVGAGTGVDGPTGGTSETSSFSSTFLTVALTV